MRFSREKNLHSDRQIFFKKALEFTFFVSKNTFFLREFVSLGISLNFSIISFAQRTLIGKISVISDFYGKKKKANSKFRI